MRSKSFLARSPQLNTEATGTAPDAFGPFRVLHQIGAGTLGPVFRGHDTQRDRLVAVKVFKLDMAPERVHQLLGELEHIVAARLAFRAIATPLAAGMTGVSAYLASEYVAAESLDLTIREFGPSTPEHALHVAAQLAFALDHAAIADIAHGALHPRDVLMSTTETRLTGIGVAQALEKVGVPIPVRRPYTAPELVADGTWDRRADVFSLAAIVYELIWGRRISGAGAPALDGLSEVAGADLAAIKTVFGRALAESPADRYPSALEFVDALRDVMPKGAALKAPPVMPSAPRPVPAPSRPRTVRQSTPPMPVASANDSMRKDEPLLPLEPPRFADLDLPPKRSDQPAGVSPFDQVIDRIGPRPTAVPPSGGENDPLAASWLRRDPDPPKAPIPEPKLVSETRIVPEPTLIRESIVPEVKPAPTPKFIDESKLASEPTLSTAMKIPFEPKFVDEPKPIAEPKLTPAAKLAPEPRLVPEAKVPAAPKPPSPLEPTLRMTRPDPVRSTNSLLQGAKDEPTGFVKPPAKIQPTFEPTAKIDAPLKIKEPLFAAAPELTPPPPELTILEKSRSAVWPLALALVLGVALGFAGGYAVGLRERPAALVAANAPPPVREFTESTVPDAPKPALADAAKSAAPVEARSAPAASSSAPVRPSSSAAPPKPEAPAKTAAPAKAPVSPPAAAKSAAAAAASGAQKSAAPAPAPPKPAAPAPAPKTAAPPVVQTLGRLNVNSVPAGARVIVDEKEAGRTPAAIRDLSQGPHTVRVVRDGYVAQERRIVLTRERPVQNVIMPLQKEKTAEVARPTPTATRGQAASAPTGLSGMSVESRPPGAKVFFDNKMIGITPLSVPEAPIGQHSIRLELDGYQNWTAAVRIVSGDQNRVRASLEPR